MAETPISRNAVYSAIPTVQIDGQANDKVTAQMLSMEMREQESGMTALEMRFSNFGTFNSGLANLMFEDGAVLKLGAAVLVYAGPVSSPTEIFRGKITAIEGRYTDDGPPDLLVLCEDALQAARMKRRTKNWDATTLSAIAQEVATNLGLTAVLNGLDTNIGDQLQLNESDLHFLRRLLARYDADVQVVGTELHAAPRAQAQRNTLEIELNSQLKQVRVIADLAQQVSQVTATGWDFAQGQAISVTSQTTSFGPGSGRRGADWLQQALGTRSEQVARAANLNTSEAQALVDAELAQRMRTFVVARGVAEGNPNLRVGTYLTLGGLGARFSNTYYVTSTVHHFDTGKGYETRFCAECAYLAGATS
jgi:phage protein D